VNLISGRQISEGSNKNGRPSEYELIVEISRKTAVQNGAIVRLVSGELLEMCF